MQEPGSLVLASKDVRNSSLPASLTIPTAVPEKFLNCSTLLNTGWKLPQQGDSFWCLVLSSSLADVEEVLVLRLQTGDINLGQAWVRLGDWWFQNPKDGYVLLGTLRMVKYCWSNQCFSVPEPLYLTLSSLSKKNKTNKNFVNIY